MNIFQKFTLQSLKKNKSRTLFTIIGIALSIALATAVIEGAVSGIGYMRSCEVSLNGAFHGIYHDLSPEQAEEASAQTALKDTASMHQVGWADAGSRNEYKPYLLIEAVDDNFTDLAAVHLVAGRMPENENEILLPLHLSDNGGVTIHTGETITLGVGERMLDGYVQTKENAFLPEENESLENIKEITYTVTGIYERFTYSIEGMSCPGYMALTKGSADGPIDLLFTIGNPASFYKYDKWQTVDMSELPYPDAHSDLLRLYGSVRNSALTGVIYGFAAVLIFLISFGTVSLIYNSFSISVSERTRQFGILKSVGATGPQLRKSVFFEAMVLCGIAIPVGLIVGCAGIGATLYFLRDAFSYIYGGRTDAEMRLIISWKGLVIAAVVGIATTLISAWIPAKRAIKVSAIDSIRQTDDIKLKGKTVRTSKLTEKLFGFEGVMASKNFKRNKKRYRSTVLSLFLSVTLFISASSFCSYLTAAVEAETAYDTGIDISYRSYEDSDPQVIYDLLSGTEGVDDRCFFIMNQDHLHFESDAVTDKCRDLNELIKDDVVTVGGTVFVPGATVFINDEFFDKMLQDHGIDIADYHVDSAPKGILTNRIYSTSYSENGSVTEEYSALEKKAFPTAISSYKGKMMEGYYGPYENVEKDGERYVTYYPEEYMQEYWNSGDYSAGPDISKAELVPEAEAFTRTEYIAETYIEDEFFPFGAGNLLLIYPYSMFGKVVTDEETAETMSFETNFAFTAKDYDSCYDLMEETLRDKGLTTTYLINHADDAKGERMLVRIVNVFAYGFIILISLIAMVNVFNTISTNITLRRREFAMLKAIGLSSGGFSKMMNYECIIYGIKGLAWGLPASVVMTYLIYRITGGVFSRGFYIPWYSLVIAVGSVFAVVFATMLYATKKISGDNLVDTLKNENI